MLNKLYLDKIASLVLWLEHVKEGQHFLRLLVYKNFCIIACRVLLGPFGANILTRDNSLQVSRIVRLFYYFSTRYSGIFAFVLLGLMMACDMWNMIEDLSTSPVRTCFVVTWQVCKPVLIMFVMLFWGYAYTGLAKKWLTTAGGNRTYELWNASPMSWHLSMRKLNILKFWKIDLCNIIM